MLWKFSNSSSQFEPQNSSLRIPVADFETPLAGPLAPPAQFCRPRTCKLKWHFPGIRGHEKGRDASDSYLQRHWQNQRVPDRACEMAGCDKAHYTSVLPFIFFSQASQWLSPLLWGGWRLWSREVRTASNTHAFQTLAQNVWVEVILIFSQSGENTRSGSPSCSF